MKYFTLNQPTPKPLNVTGAALRSVEAADAAAKAAWDNLNQKLLIWEVVLDRETIDATNLADLFEAAASAEHAKEALKQLMPRWQCSPPFNDRSKETPGGWDASAAHWHKHAADWYLSTLAAAGVPMTATGSHTAQYWRDAAARGC